MVIRLSAGADLAWKIAVSETVRARFQYIEKEQVLIGICSLEKVVHPGGLVGMNPGLVQALQGENNEINGLLKKFKLNQALLRRTLRLRVGQGNYTPKETAIHRSEACKECFEKAEKIARKRGSDVVLCIDLVAAIFEKPGSPIEEVLKKFNVKAEDIEKAVLSRRDPGRILGKEQTKTPYLDKYGIDLTALAKNKKLDCLIGRRVELLQVIRTLTRKKKSNPVIIGEAGVGKTAIVQGLAQRIAEKKVTSSLQNTRLVEIILGSLVAGTIFRGQFEERLMNLIQELKENPDIIIFIDEIHTVVGAGSGGQGSLDASNILKPALAEGQIRCIGATTLAEYRKYFEKDAALERRFQPIMVDEPGPEDTILILNGLKKRYEEHHNVKIADGVITGAVELSVRYLPDRRLPDKALDLLDEACAQKRVPELSFAGTIGENAGTVTYEDIAEVVGKWTGIPVLTKEDEKKRLLSLENSLKERVVGQDDAIRRIAKRIKKSRSGLQDPNRPSGVFLFLGPTGVGKTETAKALASFLFGSDKAMIRLDMSEYMEKHSVAKLTGAPPGYIGYDEEGQLTGALRRKPYSVVLLDEIEKAHPDLFDMFLQVFDDGRLTDAKGRTIDAKNALFIMTSNIQLSENVYEVAYGIVGDNKPEARNIQKDLLRLFRPEFVNRIDEIVVFNKLNHDDMKKIAKIMIKKLQERLTKQNLDLMVTDEVMAYLSKEGYDENFGARPLRRTIENMLEDPLSDSILSGRFRSGDQIVAKMVEGAVMLEKR